MRRFFTILLILLIPVRVFGAESMGICMHSAGQLEISSMPDDCPMMAAKSGTPAAPENQKHESGCESCQLCMTLAGPADASALSWSSPARAIPVVLFVAFQSAVILPALKPPIG